MSTTEYESQIKKKKVEKDRCICLAFPLHGYTGVNSIATPKEAQEYVPPEMVGVGEQSLKGTE